MVRIPRLSLPSVAPQDPRQPAYAAPTSRPVQNSAPAEIARLGQGLSVASDVAFDQAKKMDDERNLAVVKQHDNALADVIRREYYDPQNGFLRTRGSKALGPRRQQAEDAVEAARKQIEESLENDDQRRVFADAVSRRMQSVRAASDEHLARETTAAAIGASEAALESAVLDAQLQYGTNPDGFQASRAKIDAEIANLAELTGSAPEQTALFRRKTLSKLHENVLQGLIDKKTPLSLQQAAAYLTENGGDMLPAVAQKAKSILDQATERTVVELAAQGLDSLPFSDRITELDRQLKSGKITGDQFNDIMGATLRRADRAQAADEARRNDVLQTAKKKLDDDRLAAARDGRPPRELDAILLPSQLELVRELGLEGPVAEYATKGRFVTTSQGYQQLQQYVGRPSLLQGTTWETVSVRMMPQLNPSDFADLQKLWSQVNMVEYQGELVSFDRTDKEYLVNTALGLTSSPEDPTPEQLGEREEVWQRIRQYTMDANPKDKRAQFEAAKQIAAELAAQKIERIDGGESVPLVLADARKLNLDEFQVTREMEVDGNPQVFRAEFRELSVPETMAAVKREAERLAARYEQAGTLAAARNAAHLRRAIQDEDRYTLAGVLAGARGDSAQLLSTAQNALRTIEPVVAARRETARQRDLAALLPADGPPAPLQSITAPESMAFLESAAKLYNPEWDTPEGFAADVTNQWLKHFELPKRPRGWLAGWTEKTRPMDSDSPETVKMLLYHQFLLPRMAGTMAK